MTEIKKGVVLNYLNMIIGALIPLLYTPIMLRLLGQDEYGLYKLSSSVTGYLGLLSMGVGSAILRNLIKARTEGGHAEEQRVFSLFLVIYKCIAALILLAGAILVLNLDVWYADSLDSEALHKMQILVAIMACQTAMSFILGPYYSMITAHEKYIFAQSIGIFLTVFGPISNLLVLFLGYASIGMAVSSFIVSVIGQVIYMWYVTRKLDIHTQYRDLPWNILHEIIIFSSWIFLTQVTNILYDSTDTLMIGANSHLGTNAVAVYSVGTLFTSMLGTLTSGISSVLAPRVNNLCFGGATNEELTTLSIRIGRIQMYIVTLIICGFIAFGQPFIHLYAGDGYKDAYWISIVTMIPISIPLLQNVFLNVIMARFQIKFRSFVYLLIALLNVLGTYYILPYLGIVGAALVTGIAGILGPGIFMNWYYSKKAGLAIGLFWKSIFPIAIFPSVMSYIIAYFFGDIEPEWVALLLGILLFVVVFFIFNHAFMFNSYEKQLFSLSPILNKFCWYKGK